MPSLHDDLLFDRLASLPFVDSARDGLMIHDTVREAIRTDLEAIDPPTCQRYRRVAWQQLNHEAKSAPFRNPWRYSADLIFLINNPAIREAFFPRDVAKLPVASLLHASPAWGVGFFLMASLKGSAARRPCRKSGLTGAHTMRTFFHRFWLRWKMRGYPYLHRGMFRRAKHTSLPREARRG
jgi:hypothetical protein